MYDDEVEVEVPEVDDDEMSYVENEYQIEQNLILQYELDEKEDDDVVVLVVGTEETELHLV